MTFKTTVGPQFDYLLTLDPVDDEAEQQRVLENMYGNLSVHKDLYVLSTRYEGGPKWLPEFFRCQGWNEPESNTLLVSRMVARYMFFIAGVFAYNPNENNVVISSLANESDEAQKKRQEARWLLTWRAHAKYAKATGGGIIQLVSDEDGAGEMMKAEKDMARDWGLYPQRFLVFRYKHTWDERTLCHAIKEFVDQKVLNGRGPRTPVGNRTGEWQYFV